MIGARARLERLEKRAGGSGGRRVIVVIDDEGHVINPFTGGPTTLAECEELYGERLNLFRVGNISLKDDI